MCNIYFNRIWQYIIYYYKLLMYYQLNIEKRFLIHILNNLHNIHLNFFNLKNYFQVTDKKCFIISSINKNNHRTILNNVIN